MAIVKMQTNIVILIPEKEIKALMLDERHKA